MGKTSATRYYINELFLFGWLELDMDLKLQTSNNGKDKLKTAGALQQLQDVQFTDNSYHVGAKIIQLKCYFALNESESFYSLVDAFRLYVMRSRRISDYQRRANLNFLKLARRAFKLKEQTELLTKKEYTAKRTVLAHDLQNKQPVANLGWLVEAVE